MLNKFDTFLHQIRATVLKTLLHFKQCNINFKGICTFYNYFCRVVSFAQAQKRVVPQLLTYMLCAVLNLGLNYLYIYGLHIGFLGSALATSSSLWLMFIVMLTLTICLARRGSSTEGAGCCWTPTTDKATTNRATNRVTD